MCASKKLLAAAGFKESANVKSRVGLFKTVRDVKREALTLFWLYKSEAGFDGVCNKLEVFAAHVLLLCWGQLNYRNGLCRVKVRVNFFYITV